MTKLGKSKPSVVGFQLNKSLQIYYNCVNCVNQEKSLWVKMLTSQFQEELQDIMEELDTDKSGGVDFSEFLQFMTKQGNPHFYICSVVGETIPFSPNTLHEPVATFNLFSERMDVVTRKMSSEKHLR